jgi:DNA-directed RNA polymerase specialized sigma24 family protein
MSHSPHDIKLAERYLANPTDPDAKEAFAECCQRRLPSIASHIAFRSGMCPSFLNPNTFALDVLNLAKAQVGANLHTMRDPQSLGSWLYGIAYHAACDERNQIRRRGSNPCYWEAIERTDHEGNTVPVPDLLPEHNASYCSHDSCEEQVIREDAVRKLLEAAKEVSPKDRDATRCFIRHAAGLTPHELAAERGITAKQASALFRKGRKRLRRIAEQRLHLRSWRR